MEKTASELHLEILEMLKVLGYDELRVIHSVVEGAFNGRKIYGELTISNDPRNFLAEAGEELRDNLIYITAAILRNRDADQPIAKIEK